MEQATSQGQESGCHYTTLNELGANEDVEQAFLPFLMQLTHFTW